MYPQQTIKKTVQLMVILTLLAWATQLLFASWAKGAEPQYAQVPVELGGSEKFVPGSERLYAGATLELRPEVNVIGEEVKLKQVCRWADSDKAAFEAVADLTLFRLAKGAPFRTLTVLELRDTLHDAGVNLAVVRLAGATSCTVARTDVKYDPRTALDQWIASKDTAATKPALIEAPATQPTTPAVAKASPPRAATTTKPIPEAKEFKTLRDYILTEAADRLNLPADDIQIHFNPADDKILNLVEPLFSFSVTSPHVKRFGETTWDVAITADNVTQKAQVTASVKAWQNQIVVNKPLGYRSVIRESDLIERRALVDQVQDDPLVTREQAVGQMAGRELKTGTILTARLIEPTILVKSGQLVGITLTQGAIQAKSVARATEQGTLGQTIRVKNEVTGNMFDVVVTGPQTAKLPPSGATEKTDALTAQADK